VFEDRVTLITRFNENFNEHKSKCNLLASHDVINDEKLLLSIASFVNKNIIIICQNKTKCYMKNKCDINIKKNIILQYDKNMFCPLICENENDVVELLKTVDFVFINENIVFNDKMKYVEIIEIAKELGIDVLNEKSKRKIKSVLIDEITNAINNISKNVNDVVT
jgi:hypothetical protein